VKRGLYHRASGVCTLSEVYRSATAASMLVVQTSPVVKINRSSRSETCYTNIGISHQEPCGIAVHRHAEPSVPDVSCQKGRKNVRRFHTLQSPDSFRVLTFRKGDTVFLAEGSCQDTVGTFLNFRDDDPKWADIFERNSQVCSHPVEWLEHMPS
jgi:hypothetical protein